MKIMEVMHTQNPERAILIACQKNDRNKEHTENSERAILRAYQKSTNTSSNKPDMEKKKRFSNSMNDFASTLTEEFGHEIRPPDSVVAEIVRNSQEIECLEYDEDINISLLFKNVMTLKS